MLKTMKNFNIQKKSKFLKQKKSGMKWIHKIQNGAVNVSN